MPSSRKYYKGSSDGKRPLRHDPLADVRPGYDVIVVGSGLAAAFLAGAAGMAVAATAMLLVSRRPAPIVDPPAPGQPRFRVVEPAHV